MGTANIDCFNGNSAGSQRFIRKSSGSVIGAAEMGESSALKNDTRERRPSAEMPLMSGRGVDGADSTLD